MEYDDVANDQRQMIYSQRDQIIESNDISSILDEIWPDVFEDLIDRFIFPDSLEEQWDVPGLEALASEFNVMVPIRDWLENEKDLGERELRDRIIAQAVANYAMKREKVGPNLKILEKGSCLIPLIIYGRNILQQWIIFGKESICERMLKNNPEANIKENHSNCLEVF